jgi:hypothetical protein
MSDTSLAVVVEDFAPKDLKDIAERSCDRPLLSSKTRQVIKSRGQHCGDIELGGYLANAAGPVPLVLD